jgi:glycosyltransferase involved in cell wall biosynthesis
MYINLASIKPVVITYIITDLGTGGAEKMLYHLLSKISRLHFQPIVISLMDKGTLGDRIEKLGISVYTIGMKRGVPTPATFLRLVAILRHLKPDIIQGWMYHGNLAAQLAKFFSLQKIPVIWSIHHSIASLSLEKKMTRAIIKLGAITSRFTQGIVFVSKNSKAQHEALGYPANLNFIIPNGFDTSLFQPSEEAKLKLREELNLSEESFLIGLIGRYHPMKDHANFLKASALLAKKIPSIHYVIVGTDADCNNQILLNLIQELGISNQVHLLGERSDIPTITAALDILALSSAYGEAFPLVVGEAMSCCVPCVVTDVGDSAWIVGDTGRVVPPRDADALANAWEELILLSKDERKALGKLARARILEFFSLDFVIKQYENLYESIAEKL